MNSLLTKAMAIVSILFVLSSCARTYSIRSDDPKKVKGIPFYIQKGMVAQETKYLFKWKEITLLKETDENKTSTVLIQKSVKTDEDFNKVNELFRKLTPQSSPNEIDVIIKEIESINEVSLLSNDIKSDNVIENKWAVKNVVDYSKKYYLNSKMPWFGTSSVSQKLSSNGTITESSVTTDSQIDEVVTSVASLATPLSSIKVARIENEVSADAEKEVVDIFKKKKSIATGYTKEDLDKMLERIQTEPITYKLKIEDKGYLYTFKKMIELKDISVANTPIDFSLEKGNFTRGNWPAMLKAKKEEKPAFKVSGSIQLPDEKNGK